MRLDQLLVARGLSPSRSQARAAIEAGGVSVDGAPARSPSQSVAEDVTIVYTAAHDYVGRAALKLEHALARWPIPVAGRIVLDLGASTGGFTQVCLRREARRVYAVDVGHDQLHPKVAGDARVIDLPRTDARRLTPAEIPEAPELIVCDVSFIGLAKALPAALQLAAPRADLVTLVKPQFEMDRRADVGRGGVVRDPAARQAALERVLEWLNDRSWTVRETAESPIPGGDGNLEFLLWARQEV